MVGALDVLAHEGVDRLVADAVFARRNLAAAIGIEGSLRENLAREPDAGAHLGPVVGMAHVIEPNSWRLGRVAGREPHRPAALRAHRPDMGLKAVFPGQRRAVIGDRHRQEMELDVGIAHARARADEAAGLEMIGGAETAPAGQPVQPDEAARDEAGVAVERDRLLRGDLEIELEMVLQVLADPRTVGDDVDPEAPQLRRRADAGKFQELRRIDRPAAKNHLAPGLGQKFAPAAAVVDAGGPAAVEGDPRRQRMGDDREIRRASSPAADRRWRSTSARRPSPSCRGGRTLPAARR